MECIAEDADDTAAGEPYWQNSYFSSLDAICLYGLIALRKPSRYFEVGSGHSTRFARRAIRDCGLQTQIVSIDPAPRSEIDALCDRVVRLPLERADPSLFDELEAGDVLFIDNSHCVFTNSDATVFFLEVLPRIKPGVMVHIHDVFWPFDYPSAWSKRYYSEQYLLAAYLLAGPADRLQVILPLAYLGLHPVAGDYINRTWNRGVFQSAFARSRNGTGGYIGTSFWAVSQ